MCKYNDDDDYDDDYDDSDVYDFDDNDDDVSDDSKNDDIDYNNSIIVVGYTTYMYIFRACIACCYFRLRANDSKILFTEGKKCLMIYISTCIHHIIFICYNVSIISITHIYGRYRVLIDRNDR